MRLLLYSRRPKFLSVREWKLFERISDLEPASARVIARQLHVPEKEIRRIQLLMKEDARRCWQEHDRNEEIKRFKDNEIDPDAYGHG